MALKTLQAKILLLSLGDPLQLDRVNSIQLRNHKERKEVTLPPQPIITKQVIALQPERKTPIQTSLAIHKNFQEKTNSWLTDLVRLEETVK